MTAAMDAKQPTSESGDPPTPTYTDKHEHNAPLGRTHDAALDFLRAREGAATTTLHNDAAYARRLRRKVDGFVMPFLFVVYAVTFLDKVILNYAQIMGMTPALKLKGNDYSNASSAFYIAAVVAAVPNTYLLQRIPASKWLGTCLTCWGICTACHAALHSYEGLVAVRVLSGIFESAIPSALMLISSQYFTRGEQAIRFSFWYSGLGVAQMLGGLLSFGFQHVKASPKSVDAGWRMLFVAIGCFTVLFGISILFGLPDTPMNAWFLNDEQKVNLLEHVKVNQAGIENKHFQPGQVVESLVDPALYIGFVLSLLMGLCAGSVVSYSATLLRTFGYTPKTSALLNLPTGAVQLVSILACGFLVRYFGRRWLITFLAACGGIIGNCLLSFFPHHKASGSLAGLWLFQIISGALPIIWQWVMTNSAGHTKRAFFAAMLNAGFNIGQLISPQTFRVHDAPQYMPAKITLVVGCCLMAALALVLYGYYSYCNRRREQKEGHAEESDVDDVKAYAGLTDKQNLQFRYRT